MSQTTEPQQQRVAGQKVDVAQAATTDDQQPQQQPDHDHDATAGPRSRRRQKRTNNALNTADTTANTIFSSATTIGNGSRHQVITGVCAVRLPDLAQRCGSERTWVRMRAIGPDEVEDYVASDEWRGKAGGYAIQESADRFVTALEEGGFDNVVGLPVALTLRLLEELRRAPA